MDYLELPFTLTTLRACLWTMEGSRSTRKEPTLTQREHAKSTQKGPGQMVMFSITI